MKIENIEKAKWLGEELRNMMWAEKIIEGDGSIHVTNNSATYREITDKQTKDKIRGIILERIESIKDEIKGL